MGQVLFFMLRILLVVLVCSTIPSSSVIAEAEDHIYQQGNLIYSLDSATLRASKKIPDDVSLSNVSFIEEGSYLYITGAINNNSRAAVYHFDFDIIYKDNQNRVVEEETYLSTSIIGYPDLESMGLIMNLIGLVLTLILITETLFLLVRKPILFQLSEVEYLPMPILINQL